jgi:rhamnulokinase
MNYNFTNEGGIDYRYRFLKNIMGLWIIQEVRKNLNNRYSFEEIANMAGEHMNFKSIINVDDDRFLKPQNMIQEIKKYCSETSQDIPQNLGEIAFCVFNSLARSYKASVESLEEIFEKKFKKINIFGGGCKNEFLNELVAKVTGKTVIAGPSEATAIGNISAQLLSTGVCKGISEVRKLIRKSFNIRKYLG